MKDMWSLGIPDEVFCRGKVPMTKREIRILALAYGQIKETDCVVDVGAGSGSISIEAAFLAHKGEVYAIERENDGVETIRKNIAKFGVGNISLLEGAAPKVMDNIPSANVIFIGGSGGCLLEIMDRSDQLLVAGGRLVLTAITVETLAGSFEWFRSHSQYRVEASGVQVTRINPVGKSHMMQSLNQIYIIAATKQ